MSCKVRLVPGNRTFEVAAAETILEAALAQGISLPYSCRSGSCGACSCQRLGGEVDYPDGLPLGLSQAEHVDGVVFACRAHARSDLVLEAQELQSLSRLSIKTLPARVVRMQQLGHDVMRVDLRLPAVEPLDFLAGQYVDILLRDGARRSFSIANAPRGGSELELHIRHVPGGEFTTRVFEELREKSLVRLQGPLGSFYLREGSERPLLLVGGGTGFAPLKSIVEHMLNHGIERQLHLYWGVRTRRDLYSDLPQRWSRELPGFEFTPVLSEADAGWRGRRGWVHEAVLQDHPELAGHDVYMAGPPPMIDSAVAAFTAAGLPGTQLFYDSFEFAPEVQAALDRQAMNLAAGQR